MSARAIQQLAEFQGALLSTRKEAVKLGLLSQASFDAGLALSQAMTQLQPAVAGVERRLRKQSQLDGLLAGGEQRSLEFR